MFPWRVLLFFFYLLCSQVKIYTRASHSESAHEQLLDDDGFEPSAYQEYFDIDADAVPEGTQLEETCLPGNKWFTTHGRETP